MAKPFIFKLDKVLDYRGQLEEQAKAALAQAQEQFDAKKKIVADMELRYSAHIKKEGESRTSANDMWLWRQYKDALEQDISIARVEIKNLELKLQQARTKAVECAREKKLLEKLKETQAKKHHEEENAREEKENDEMATIRYESKNI